MIKQFKFSLLYAWPRLVTRLALLLLIQSPAQAEIHASPEMEALRILQTRCFNCHGAEKQEGQLRLDQPDWLSETRGEERLVNSDAPNESLLLKVTRTDDPQIQMPPKAPLEMAEIAILERWIQAGAAWPSPQSNASQASFGPALIDRNNPIHKHLGAERLELWSLRPVQRPALPAVANSNWAQTPIDLFVLADWESRFGKELLLAEDCTPSTFVRRIAYDLTGLPPDTARIPLPQVRRSELDQTECDRIVQRLLASPDYGVRWARLWLDAVRYSDSNGFDWDEFRPQAWRYRDYVVNAWNSDLPYDQFILEQLAGDEQFDGHPANEQQLSQLVATGYLRMGPHDNAAALFDEQDRSRAELMADLTETTGSAFLGLTLACCRCHDHKTDPLLQADHYRLRSFFASVQFADDLALDPPTVRESIEQHNEKLNASIAEIDNRLKAIETQVADGNDGKAKAEIDSRVEALKQEKKSLQSQMRSTTIGLTMKDGQGDPPKTFIFYQGDHKAPREEVMPGFPTVLGSISPEIKPVPRKSSTGRRTALAHWIATPENPWTARVLVNRVWQSHFGVGLVATPNDFGITGERPNLPELLDWLADELIRSGWSVKHIQQLITTSRVYRQTAVPASSLHDPQFPKSLRVGLRRMDAEAVRDAMLYASGLLLRTSGGPPSWPHLPPEVLQANPAFLDDNETKTKGWYPSPPELQTVRSLFLVQKRGVKIPFMEAFDLPDNSVSCPRRESSIVATQALSLLNGDWSRQASEALAEQIEASDPASNIVCIHRAYEAVFQRMPTPKEQQLGTEFLDNWSLVELCRALMNTNEFIFVE